MKQNNKYCHSELVSESIVTLTRANEFNPNSQRGSKNGFRTKSGMTGEYGRSMVEMLGILAIIGVLSVGGISGYTTAMNKHKANEILNAAAVRAMAVSSQLQNGTPIGSVSLGEFDNENHVGGAVFDDEVQKVSDTQFKIGFTTPPSDAVLAQMVNIVGNESIVKSLEGGLTYNNDLGTGEGTTPEGGDTDSCNGCVMDSAYQDNGCYDPEGIKDCSSCKFASIELGTTPGGNLFKCVKETECLKFCDDFCFTESTMNDYCMCSGEGSEWNGTECTGE